MADDKVVLDDVCPICSISGNSNKLVLYEDGAVECPEGHSFGPSSSSTETKKSEPEGTPIEAYNLTLSKVPTVIAVLPDRGAILAVRISENDYRDLMAATRDQEDPAEMFQRTLEYGLSNGWFSGCYVSK